jgi:hypothetical protein
VAVRKKRKELMEGKERGERGAGRGRGDRGAGKGRGLGLALLPPLSDFLIDLLPHLKNKARLRGSKWRSWGWKV